MKVSGGRVKGFAHDFCRPVIEHLAQVRLCDKRQNRHGNIPRPERYSRRGGRKGKSGVESAAQQSAQIANLGTFQLRHLDSSGRYRRMAGLHGPCHSPSPDAPGGAPCVILCNSRNLAHACGHGWDRLGTSAVHCRYADPFRVARSAFCFRDVRPPHLAVSFLYFRSVQKDTELKPIGLIYPVSPSGPWHLSVMRSPIRLPPSL